MKKIPMYEEKKQLKSASEIIKKLSLLFVISLFVFFLLIKLTDTHKVVSTFKNADLKLLSLALLKIPLIIIIQIFRWDQILKSKHIIASYSNLYKAAMIGCFFNNITPGLKTGGEPMRAYYLAKMQNIDLTKMMASVAVERMLQWIALASISVISIILSLFFASFPSSTIKLLLGIILGFSALTALIYYVGLYKFSWILKAIDSGRNFLRFITRSKKDSHKPSWISKIEKFQLEYAGFFLNKVSILIILGLTFFQFGIDFLFPWLIFKALNVNVPLIFILFGTIANRISGVFAITPGGSGIVESVNYSFYAIIFSVAQESVVVQTLLFRVLDGWLLWLISGITVGFIGHEFLRKKTHDILQKETGTE